MHAPHNDILPRPASPVAGAIHTPAPSTRPGLAARWSVWLVLLGCLAYGYSLDRYPSFYVDDVVFAYPAMEAVAGRPFAYPGGVDVPYVHQIWAYHGPLLPNLQIGLFKLFGFSVRTARLPDFLGGWLAVLLLVLFLNRKGYRYAGLAFAVLWCGDRAAQEILYGRMDGLALLLLVLTFLALEKAWIARSPRAAFLCGLCAGLSILTHPLCAAFAGVAFVLACLRTRWHGAAAFTLGGLLNLPLLIALWHFQPAKALTQFLWVSLKLNKITGVGRTAGLLPVLRWSRYWFVALVIVAIASALWSLAALFQRRKLAPGTPTDLFLAGSFCFAALVLLYRSSLFPYYIIYFSVWPMLFGVILAETHWRRARPYALLLALIWCSSAAWNVMRLREPAKFYSALSHRFLLGELRRDVPPDATIVTTAELYALPLEDGYTHRDLTSFGPEHQDICPTCYLLITELQYTGGEYIPRSNLDRRRILYHGPAFPGAGPLTSPVVILSPELPTPAGL